MLSSLTTLLRNPHFFHHKGPASDGPHSGFSTYSQKYPCITLRLQYTYIQPSFFTTLWLFFRCIPSDLATRDGRGGLQQWQRGDSDLRWGNGPVKFLRATNEECYRCPRRIAAGISGPSGRLTGLHTSHTAQAALTDSPSRKVALALAVQSRVAVYSGCGLVGETDS